MKPDTDKKLANLKKTNKNPILLNHQYLWENNEIKVIFFKKVASLFHENKISATEWKERESAVQKEKDYSLNFANLLSIFIRI